MISADGATASGFCKPQLGSDANALMVTNEILEQFLTRSEPPEGEGQELIPGHHDD